MEVLKKWLMSGNALGSLIVIILAVVVWVITRKVAGRLGIKPTVKGERASAANVTLSVIRSIIIISAVLFVLQINGVNITSMIAGFGLASAIVGLALQDILKDVIMGMHIMSDGFFSVGDWVELDGVQGKIVGFTLKTTKIRSIDGTVLSVCNRDISSVMRLGNVIIADVPVPYGSDDNVVNQALKTAGKNAEKTKGIDHIEYKGLNEFGDSAIIHRYLVYCDRDNLPEIKRSLFRNVKNQLDEVNISIPFNQLDVHIEK